MNQRLIDVNVALRKVEQIPYIENENKAFHEGCRYMQKKVLRIFHESKAIDAEPVRHGHWIVGLDGSYMCSECEKVFRYEIGNYCSACGARLEYEE